MLEPPEGSEPGWYRTPDDPPGTHRYWDGNSWIGDAQPIPADGERRPAGIDEPLASPSLRILARIIDVFVTVFAIVLIAGLVDGGFVDGTPSRLASFLGLVFSAAYEILSVAWLGGTIGKLVLGLRIVTTTGASPPDIATATRRWAPNLVTILPVLGSVAGLVLLVISLAWITSDPGRRSAFDRIGGTFVVKRDAPRVGAWS